MSSKKTAQPNVLPDWWSFAFIGVQAFALLPLAYDHVTNPIGAFKSIIPDGYDPATDKITSSLRVELAASSGAQSYLMIGGLFIACTLFARNALRGQPRLQQQLVKIPIYAGLFSDAWLYLMLIYFLPAEIKYNMSNWSPAIKGIAFGLPGATTLKAIYLLGVGRDVV